MGVHISLRTENDISFFYRYINEIINISEAKTILIASGYYNNNVTSDICNLISKSNIENVKLFGGRNYPPFLNNFFKLKENHSELAPYSESFFSYYRILYNEKFNIVKKVEESKKFEVRELKGYIQNDLEFLNFFKSISALNTSKKGFSSELRLFTSTNSNWHAKIMIVLDKSNIPLAGIIGSSNLTKPPYIENGIFFNYESDVIIYDPTYESEFQSVRNNIIIETKNDASLALNKLPVATKIDYSLDPISEIERLKDLVNLLERNSSKFSV